MTLIDAINKYEILEKNNKSQYLIISDSYNVCFLCPIYDVISTKLVIAGFIDVNLSFHLVHPEMFSIYDWRIVEVEKTILNNITESNNIISINNVYYDFYVINISMLYKPE